MNSLSKPLPRIAQAKICSIVSESDQVTYVAGVRVRGPGDWVTLLSSKKPLSFDASELIGKTLHEAIEFIGRREEGSKGYGRHRQAQKDHQGTAPAGSS